MTRRRALLARVQSGGIDTSPKIAEYGKRLFNKNTTTDAADCCYTVFYDVNDVPTARVFIRFNSTAPYPKNLVQSWDNDNPIDFGYAYAKGEATIYSGTTRVRFTLLIDERDNTYSYNPTDGQIFFAGRNTPYYGYTNIHDMPTGT